jgi:lipopolysaccharide export system protein LptA
MASAAGQRDPATPMSPRTAMPTMLMLALLLVGAPAVAQGVKADRDAPIQVEADHMTYDDARQVNVFTGRVHMVRGQLTVLADRIVLRQDEAGNQFATATGNPARFRQVRKAEGDVIEGEAKTLDYDSRGDVLKLREEASMRRLEGERVVNEVFGAQITYQGATDFFTVERGDGKGATPANPSGRVRVVIQPRSSGGNGGDAGQKGPATPLQPAQEIDLGRSGAKGG